MLSYLSKTPGISGEIKSAPQDFRVEEIGEDGAVFEIDKQILKDSKSGKFTHFILQKIDWSTSSAISEIARRLHSSQSRFNTAGVKDKFATTTQLVSGYGFTPDQVLSVKIKDIQINGAWFADDKVRIGQLLGNRFQIRIKNPESLDRIETIYNELNGVFPNYFGEQRFGSTRKNTHKIGMLILRNDFEGAVRSFLCDSSDEENPQSIEARKQLESEGNYDAALNYFPKHLRLERTIIASLAARPGDYASALRKLPRSNLLMFVHAVQSYLFNQLLSDRIAISLNDCKPLEIESGEYYCGSTNGFPDLKKTEASGFLVGRLVGYETMLNDQERGLLEKLDLTKDHFKLNSMPELSSKGGRRLLLAPLIDFSHKSDLFKFSLPLGCYATVAMREFMKNVSQD